MSPSLTDSPHFLAVHLAVHHAFVELETVREAQGRHPNDCGLNPSEYYRLRQGTAGFAGLAKYALSLGYTVAIALTPVVVAVESPSPKPASCLTDVQGKPVDLTDLHMTITDGPCSGSWMDDDGGRVALATDNSPDFDEAHRAFEMHRKNGVSRPEAARRVANLFKTGGRQVRIETWDPGV